MLLLRHTDVLARRRWRIGRSVNSEVSGFYGADPVELILGIFTVISAAGLVVAKFYNRGKASINLRVSARQDPIWHEQVLERHTLDTFQAMQRAWLARDMSGVRDRVTEEFFQRYTAHFAMNKQDQIINIVEDVEVTTVLVLGAEDYKDDSRDTYSARISGAMCDYTISEVTGKPIRNVGKEITDFADNYYFIRMGERWLLREIDTKGDDIDIAVSKNYRER